MIGLLQIEAGKAARFSGIQYKDAFYGHGLADQWGLVAGALYLMDGRGGSSTAVIGLRLEWRRR
ncbi:MAG: hypothetical protein Marn2KO_26410 [Marinobacter nauticus]